MRFTERLLSECLRPAPGEFHSVLDGITEPVVITAKLNQLQDISFLEQEISGASSVGAIDLSINDLEEIVSFAKFDNLRLLDLSFNHITQLRKLTGLNNLRILNLSNNLLKKLDDLPDLPQLTDLVSCFRFALLFRCL